MPRAAAVKATCSFANTLQVSIPYFLWARVNDCLLQPAARSAPSSDGAAIRSSPNNAKRSSQRSCYQAKRQMFDLNEPHLVHVSAAASVR